MDSFEGNGNGNGNGVTEGLPPPPPVPENVVPLKAEPEHVPEPVKKKIMRVPIARRGLASKGSKIPILTNHFKVNVTNVDGHFFHYSVCCRAHYTNTLFQGSNRKLLCFMYNLLSTTFIYFTCFEQVALFYEDGRPVDGKGIGRKVLDRVHETYDTELAGKEFAYDGEKSLFTVGALPRNKLEFTVVLEDITSNRYMYHATHLYLLYLKCEDFSYACEITKLHFML